MKRENEQGGEIELSGEPELEARLIAWIAGELSGFDAQELECLVAARPELARFKERIELVRELVQDAGQCDREPLRLSSERRAKLLKTLGASGDVLPLRQQRVVPPPKPRWWQALPRPYLVAGGMAAGVLVALFNLARQPRIFQKEAELHFKDRDRGVVQVQQVVDSSIRSGGGGVAVEKVVRANEGGRRMADDDPLSSVASAAPEMAAAQFVKEAKPDGTGLVLTTVSEPPVVMSEFRVTDSPMSVGAVAMASNVLGGIRISDDLLVSRGDAVFGSGGLSLGAAGASAAAPSSAPRAVTLDAAAVPQVNTARGPFSVGAFDDRGFLFSSRVTVGGGEVSGEKAAADTVVGARLETEGKVTLSSFGGLAMVEGKKAKNERAPAPKSGNPLPAEGEARATEEAVSTFSLHVGDVSFRLAQAALAARLRGETPADFVVRAEEFYNAFDYGDPAPTEREKISARIEQAAHPVLSQRNLLRIALQVAANGRTAQQPLHLTVLLDTSGSMERDDRRRAVRRALEGLAGLLGEKDRVSLIGFARQPRLLAENVPGDRANEWVQLAAVTPPDGGTNLEEALRIAAQVARRNRGEGAQNRIVLLTDGAANLGDADPVRLMEFVVKLREQGVAFDACGVGLEGIGDTVLEALTRKGDGRYYVLDRPEVADEAFARKLAGAFRPAAENVKVQVRFNPARVGAYRLIGFDRHRLATEDFRNDAVDAAELSADEAGVAMYQVEVLAGGAGDVGEVSARFRDPATGEMVERTWPISYVPQLPLFDRAAPSLQLAGVATILAEKLAATPVGAQANLKDLVSVTNQLPTLFPNQPRVHELVTMFQQLRRLHRE